MHYNKIKIIDIGHSNLKLDEAQIFLETSISQASYEGDIKIIKIITGHGSGALKQFIRQWLKDQEGRFQEVIYGEDYHMFNTKASDMRYECNIDKDPDFGRKNSAITYVWLW
tara:strand:- start:144 stop:479 length:336 start_codon:yes stop_codon:yes gene_type:complete